MMPMSTGGSKPHQMSSTTSVQKETSDTKIDSATADRQQSKRNTSKRAKEGDDSFEHEHRMANLSNQYFNSNNIRQEPSEISPRSTGNGTNSATRRPSFPPVRITFTDDECPSELSIIKDINKHCRISLSYGRYSSIGQKKSFLLYANSSEQFDRLMEKKMWPSQICSLDYLIDFPSKVPSSYSIVVLGIPAQWNLTEFEIDIKKQYPTIIKAERLYIKGGIPISKVRIDFSSNQEINKILKDKRLLLDDENTSFAIQPYTPPLKVLRCYNCQQYNDHIATNCPHKDNPVCFRCGQNHAYNPNCMNKISCANCHQDHLAGNPNCRVKIEERKKFQSSLIKPIMNKSNQQKSSYPVWTTNETVPNTILHPSSPVEVSHGNSDPMVFLDISKKLDLIMTKIENFSIEQEKIKSSIVNFNKQLVVCHEEINTMKEFIFDKLCTFIGEISETISGKCKLVEKDKLRVLSSKFKEDFKNISKARAADSRSTISLTKSSSNESIDQDV